MKHYNSIFSHSPSNQRQQKNNAGLNLGMINVKTSSIECEVCVCVRASVCALNPLRSKLPVDGQANGCHRGCADGQTVTHSSSCTNPIPSAPLPSSPLASASTCPPPRCAAVGQVGRDGQVKERGRDGVRHMG